MSHKLILFIIQHGRVWIRGDVKLLFGSRLFSDHAYDRGCTVLVGSLGLLAPILSLESILAPLLNEVHLLAGLAQDFSDTCVGCPRIAF